MQEDFVFITPDTLPLLPPIPLKVDRKPTDFGICRLPAPADTEPSVGSPCEAERQQVNNLDQTQRKPVCVLTGLRTDLAWKSLSSLRQVSSIGHFSHLEVEMNREQ